MGLIRLTDPNKKKKGYQHELILGLDQRKIYSLDFTFHINKKFASKFRKKLLDSIIFKESSFESAVSSYNQYKSLTFNEKISQFGLFHLLSAWSHNRDNHKFLKEIIQFSERKGVQQVSLKFLYDYAYKKFGTNFSRKEDKVKETASKRLDRKISEEDKKDVQELDRTPAQATPDNFNSGDERIDYFLNKGEQENLDYDQQEDTLIIE